MATDSRSLSRSTRVLVDELAQEIQGRVMAGTIPIGSWLRQEPLAAEFGVSRTPVREALRKLEASGVVDSCRPAGAATRGRGVVPSVNCGSPRGSEAAWSRFRARRRRALGQGEY